MENNIKLKTSNLDLFETEFSNILEFNSEEKSPFLLALSNSVEEASKGQNFDSKTPEPLNVFEGLNKIPFRSIRKIIKSNYSKSLQQWQGVVIEIRPDSFFAELTDLTLGGTKEVAEFFFSDISEGDLKKVSKGSVFYWSVGYTTINGQRSKESIVRFQRLIPWTEDDYNIAIDRATEWNNKLVIG